VKRQEETYVEKERKFRKRREISRKSWKKQEKAEKKQEKSKRNSFHRWTQINADVQKIKMFLSVFICG